MDTKQIMADHARWLRRDPRGKQANLIGADLSGLNLQWVPLPDARVIGAYWQLKPEKLCSIRFAIFTNKRTIT